jgi:CobQ-like glutamine amidotransferase family enzyme
MDARDHHMVTIALLYPELLGTYGDGGNARVLARRAIARGIATTIISVGTDNPLPDADIYLLGGGEDGPQRFACEALRRSDFTDRVAAGATVLAVCAGLQILGTSFCVEGNDAYAGLGVVDAVTERGPQRAVGDLRVSVAGRALIGFENHGGRTTLGSTAPLGVVEFGVGNDGVVDGFRHHNVFATYAHGPVLAINPWFADELLITALGVTLAPLHTMADELYAERCRAIVPR